MNVYDYLNNLPARSNNKLAPHLEEIRVLYSGNASFAAIVKYLIETHGVSVTRQGVSKFCKRYCSNLVSIRRGTKASQNDPSTPTASQSPPVQTVEQARTEVTVGYGTSRGPGADISPLRFDVADDQRSVPHSSSTHDSALLPSSVSPPSVRLPRDNSSSDSTTLSNEAQLGGAFPAREVPSESNMDHADASGALPADQLPAVSLFGPAENLRIPHDLNKQSGKERMARYLKAKAAREA
jgi:hypothetical protein